MKDLILVGTYCPDLERQKILNGCIDSLQKGRDKYDILVCSHTIIPDYIQQKVDYVFYDKENEVIFDMEYLNQPWFSPNEKSVIKSTFVGSGSTYLAAYRILISGLGIGKTYNYKKVHFIEYDSIWNNLTPIDINSNLLETHDSILIRKKPTDYEDNIYWGQGFFISFNLEKINSDFLIFDREKLLDRLLNSKSKTNEKITEDILSENGRKIHFINYEDVDSYGNQYKLSNQTQKESLSGWVVPYYNPENDKVYVISWNDRYDLPLNTSFIINEEEIITINGIGKYEWSIREVGNIDSIDSIFTIVNGRQKNRLIFTDKFKEDFKKTNYITFN